MALAPFHSASQRPKPPWGRQIWEHLNIEALEEGSILIVFRSDIPPDHNHAANRCGGRWFVRGVATEPRTKLWTKLTLAMLSDTLPGPLPSTGGIRRTAARPNQGFLFCLGPRGGG